MPTASGERWQDPVATRKTSGGKATLDSPHFKGRMRGENPSSLIAFLFYVFLAGFHLDLQNLKPLSSLLSKHCIANLIDARQQSQRLGKFQLMYSILVKFLL